MKRTTKTLISLLTTGLLLGGCFSDETPPVEGADTDGETDAGETDDVDPPDPPLPPPGTTGTTGPDPDSSGDASETDGETDGETEFEFDEAPPEDYTVQIDRTGMPAVASATITDREAYNAASPADDAAGVFVDDIVANLTGLHEALDDDLIAAGLVPCDVATCVAQAGPLVIPDTLSIDLTMDAGFPNGRLPEDTVMDVTLAVVLLDLGAAGQGVTTLVGLNPTENDVEFSDQFPYFAPAHQ
ncbi:MAG: DUF4331 domain-containing protein [Deltaproteobacteria bacterium]|nr:DUF4331 domain-containing protein [Deltaproteobacteria bacterium]